MVSRNLYSLYRPWCRVIYIAYTGRGVEKFILCFLFLFFQKNNTYYQRIEYSCLRKPVVFASLPEHILCYCLPSSKICFINVSEEPVTDFLYRPQGRAYFGYRFRFNVFSFPWLLLFFLVRFCACSALSSQFLTIWVRKIISLIILVILYCCGVDSSSYVSVHFLLFHLCDLSVLCLICIPYKKC